MRPQRIRPIRRKKSSGRRNAVARLHELTERVAADVGEHSSRVQEISEELTQNTSGGELDSVVLGSVARIIEVNSQLQEQLKSAEVKLQEQAHQIEVHAADALTDALTGKANRRAFDAELEPPHAGMAAARSPVLPDDDRRRPFQEI